MASQQGSGEGEFEDVRLEEGNGASDSNGAAGAGGSSASGADVDLRSGDGSAYGNGVSGPSDSSASGGDRSGEASGNDAQPSSSSSGGGGSANAAPIIGGSIVGDVLYSIATGEEEGKSRARILAFAAKRYQNAVEKNPRDYDALYNWALVLQESADNCGPDAGLQGKDSLLEDACKKYQAATDLCSTLHEAFYNWAIAISDRAKIRGRTAEAEALWKQACDKYERAVQLNWDSPQALNNWGLALQELGTIVPAKEKRTVIRKAIHKFRAAIRLRFDFHRAIYNLGTVLYGLAEDTAKSEKRNAAGHPPLQPPVSAEIYSQSAVYIASAHALKSDYPVYRNALRLVRTMLPLPYLKGGYLTVPPFGDSFAPHAEWRRRWFVLDHENLKEGKKPEPRQSAMQLHAARRSSSNPSAAAGAATGAAAAAAQIAPTASITFPVSSGVDGVGSSVETFAGDASTYEPKTSTATSAAASARSSLAAAAASAGVDLTVPQQEEPPPVHIAVADILSVEACADLSLPKGGGIVLGTASGPFYMVADDWEAMDAWVDAIRLVYTVYVRGKNEEMAAVLAG